jgi:Mrp family chromosome partitioning ATPase
MAAEAGIAAAQLSLLPGGEAGSGTGEILLRSEVGQLLRELASRYDYVIIDSPPLLATDDATSLASKVDGVFMVVRASFTYSRMVREALERLHKCRGKILGLVYNRAATSTDYYYRYSQDYSSPPTGVSVTGDVKG